MKYVWILGITFLSFTKTKIIHEDYSINPICHYRSPIDKSIAVEHKTKKIVSQKKKEKTSLKGIRFFCKNKTVSNKMNDILNTYNGPAMLITSATRKWSVKSNHYHGNAIDIDWRNGGEEVLEYLINSDWAEANGLRFFVEDKRNDSSFLKESYKKYFRVIRHATGKHIHLELN